MLPESALRFGVRLSSAALLLLCLIESPRADAAESHNLGAVSKLNDLVIYNNQQFYSSFPSIVRRSSGELLVAFRRAPDRRLFGERGVTHTDANSQLMLVRSRDDGKTWGTPELIYAHAFGGSQDPCMLQLHDGTILCFSYGWMPMQPDVAGKLKDLSRLGNFVFLGGYLVRSEDGGHTWQGPIFPPAILDQKFRDPFGKPLPAYNRGAPVEGKDQKIYWATAGATSDISRTGTHLLVSEDKGSSWRFASKIASDDKIEFNETSLHETAKGDLVAFMRTEAFDDHTAIARSTNHGVSFQPWEDAGFQGHPHFALGLPDKRVLLVYGYRHPPFGIRARVLNSECTNAGAAPEIFLRQDGGNGDLGYPWAVQLDEQRVLVVYYFNLADWPRHIAGTVLKVD